MKSILIKNAQIVNEGTITVGDVYIKNQRIEKIASSIDQKADVELDATGKYLMPGIIDDQVHFREPGLTHKSDLYTEPRSAVAGGVTSFMEMPNTKPNALTQRLLQDKYDIAAQKSLAKISEPFQTKIIDKIYALSRADPQTWVLAARPVRLFYPKYILSEV